MIMKFYVYRLGKKSKLKFKGLGQPLLSFRSCFGAVRCVGRICLADRIKLFTRRALFDVLLENDVVSFGLAVSVVHRTRR